MALASRALRRAKELLDEYDRALDLPWEERAPKLAAIEDRLGGLWGGMKEPERREWQAHEAANYQRRIERAPCPSPASAATIPCIP